MDIENKFFALLLLSILTFLLNLPFGFARARTRRFSFRWFLCIHVPIPVIFIIRNLSHIEMNCIPLFAIAALSGQLLGGRLHLS